MGTKNGLVINIKKNIFHFICTEKKQQQVLEQHKG